MKLKSILIQVIFYDVIFLSSENVVVKGDIVIRS